MCKFNVICKHRRGCLHSSVFVLSSEDEPDIFEFDSSCCLVLRNE